MAFYVVYIREAHASDGWQMEVNLMEDVVYAQHTSMDERAEAAHTCSVGLDISMPMLLDEMTNEVDAAYAALPDRLYVVGADGLVAYRSGPGPWGFDPDEFEAAVRACVDAG